MEQTADKIIFKQDTKKKAEPLQTFLNGVWSLFLAS